MDELSAAITRYIVIGSVALIISFLGSCQMTNYQIRKAVEAGATPLAARCALAGDGHQCDVLEAAEAEANRGN